MRGQIALLTLSLVAAIAASGQAAPTFGTPVNSGDKVVGTIESASDRDQFRVDAPDGSILQIAVKASKKSPLLPALGLIDPAGNEVDLALYVTGLGTPTVAVPVIGIHVTGTWTVAVKGYLGSTGSYDLSIKVAVATKVRATVVVASGATLNHTFTGVDGARLDYAIVEKSGPGLVGAEILDPAGDAIPGTAAVRSGKKLQAKKLVLQGSGLCSLAMTNASGGPTTVDVTTTVKLPKVKTKKVTMGTEPRPTAVSPTTGRNGTAFVLTGTGFEPGARVFFAGTDEAVDVVFVSSTEVHGQAPESDASRNGESVALHVVNPDGQFGNTTSKFAYIGIPGPTAFTPKLSPLEGGVTVTVSGTRFRAGYTVEVDGIPAISVSVLGANVLTFQTPAAPAGNFDVVVKDEFGRPADPMPGLWYSSAPDVVSADPSELSSLGGVTVTLEGSGLVPGTRVFVAGTEATVQSVVPPTSVSFLCPAARSGDVEVEVRDALGRSFTANLLHMTRALHDETIAALPAPPLGADFYGDIVNLGDTSGDGLPEILVTSHNAPVNPSNAQPLPGSLLFANLGDGAFADATGLSLPGFGLPGDDGQGDAAVMGDLDGDGLADAALVRAETLATGSKFVMYSGYKAYYDINYPTTVDAPTAVATRFLANDGTGLLKDETDGRAPSQESTPALGLGERWQGQAASLGDLDGDGDADLLLVAGGRVDVGTITGVSYTYTYYYSYYYGYKYKYKDKAILAQESVAVGSMRVLLNDGSGAFSHYAGTDPAPVIFGAGTVLDDFRGSAVATGDLDGDGIADAVLVSAARTQAPNGQGGVKDAPGLRILLNDGSGALSLSSGSVPQALGATSPESGEWWQGQSVTLGDFDGDGDLDIAVGRPSVATWLIGGAGAKRVLPALRLFRNGGSGTFTEDTEAFLDPDLTVMATGKTMLGISAMSAVDFDGDGDTDLVVTGRVTNPPGISIPGGARMCTRILINDGEAGMRDATAEWLSPVDLQPADGVAAGDLDGDGFQDLVLVLQGSAGEGKRSLRVLLNR